MTKVERVSYFALFIFFIVMTAFAARHATYHDLITPYATAKALLLFALLLAAKKLLMFAVWYGVVGAVKRGAARRVVMLTLERTLAAWVRLPFWVHVVWILAFAAGIALMGKLFFALPAVAAVFVGTVVRYIYRLGPGYFAGWVDEELEHSYARWRHRYRWLKRTVFPYRYAKWTLARWLETRRERHFARWESILAHLRAPCGTKTPTH